MRHKAWCAQHDPVSGECDCGAHGEREIEVLRVERDQARAQRDHVLAILTRIHGCIAPPEFTDKDGKRWRYNGPENVRLLQMLSDRIRAIPDEIAKMPHTEDSPK